MPRCRLLVLLLLLLLAANHAQADLTTATSIRQLSPEAAAAAPAAKLRGVVTFNAQWRGQSNTAIQDTTAGIFVSLVNAMEPKLQLGDEVEITGEAAKGGYVPLMRANQVRVLGRGTLPEPERVDLPQLRSGRLDSQWVVVEGIVRDVQHDGSVTPPSTILTLALPGGRAEVFMALVPEADFQSLIDARVEVRAVCFQYFNARRQSFQFRLMACEATQLTVLTPSPAAPFALPITPLHSLLQFDPKGTPLHRLRVQGRVSLHWPGEFFFLQDGTDGVLVRSRQKEPLRAGDQVDVAAFAAMGPYAGTLEDAVYQKIPNMDSQLATPSAVRFETLVDGRMDARLVSTEALLESIALREDHAVLMLRKGSLVVPAELPVPLDALPALRIGSLVRITGVCQIQVGPQRRFARVFQPESARLLLRGVEDITVLRAASWWTSQRLAIALIIAVSGLGLTVLWLSGLHRRNARLQAEISAREQAEAEVKRRVDERHLLAADLHDTLEQSLTGVALQLQATRDALDRDEVDEEEAHLTLAERLLAHSRAEVHRAVRDLRSPSQQSLDLPAALRELVRLSSAASKAKFSLTLPESLSDLPSHLAYPLLRIAQEAVTNALKHASASRIGITLDADRKALTLTIQDDGISFDTISSPGPAQGHFGLQGIKERTARLNGTLRLHSQHGQGTRLIVTLPFPT